MTSPMHSTATAFSSSSTMHCCSRWRRERGGEMITAGGGSAMAGNGGRSNVSVGGWVRLGHGSREGCSNTSFWGPIISSLCLSRYFARQYCPYAGPSNASYKKVKRESGEFNRWMSRPCSGGTRSACEQVASHTQSS